MNNVDKCGTGNIFILVLLALFVSISSLRFTEDFSLGKFLRGSDYKGQCHEECEETSGCWGPMPGQCRKCKHNYFSRSQVRVCTNTCNLETHYLSGKECITCHKECVGCSGPWNDQCHDCRHLSRRHLCTAACYPHEFNNSGECTNCHDSCLAGCSGPGADDCHACPKLLILKMNRNRNYSCSSKICYRIKACLGLNDTCPDGYFQDQVPPDVEGQFAKISGRPVCTSCHEYCTRCTGYGFNSEVCQECPAFKSCSCPPHEYFDVNDDYCNECAENCKTCSESGRCIECGGDYSFRVYDAVLPSSNGIFKCMKECPQYQPHPYFDTFYQNYCSSLNETQRRNLERIHDNRAEYGNVVSTVGVVLFLITLICLVVVFVWFRHKMTENVQVEDIEEKFAPSKVSPNRNKLKIIRESDVIKTEVLGKGAFGIVYRGTLTLEGCKARVPVAIKVFNPQNRETSTKELLKEAGIMGRVDHPNLVRLLAICVTSNVMLVTQLMPQGDLLRYLHRYNREIKPKTMLSWSAQIAKGMDYLEKHKLVHRDLAARNVLVQTRNKVKVTDFGLARVVEQGIYASKGGKLPVKWLALESLTRGIFTHKTDVWSLGITVWEILTYGEEPYGDESFHELVSSLEAGERLQQPQICSADLYTVLATCWAEEATARPSFQELVDTFTAMVQESDQFVILSSGHDKGPSTPEPLPRNIYFQIEDEDTDNPQLVSHSYENISRDRNIDNLNI